MPSRRIARVVAPVIALVLLAPLACATRADRAQQRALRDAALARVAANAPSGVFSNGLWNGTVSIAATGMTTSSFARPAAGIASPTGALAQPMVRDIAVEVYEWRDSARVALVLDGVGSSVAGRTARLFPEQVRIAGDTMTFALARLDGWYGLQCRLVARRTAEWRGACGNVQEPRAATLELHLPRVASR